MVTGNALFFASILRTDRCKRPAGSYGARDLLALIRRARLAPVLAGARGRGDRHVLRRLYCSRRRPYRLVAGALSQRLVRFARGTDHDRHGRWGLTRVLDAWDRASDAAAVLHMAAQRSNVRPGPARLIDAHLTGQFASAAETICAFLSRPEVDRRLEAAFFAADDTHLQQLLSDAMWAM